MPSSRSRRVARSTTTSAVALLLVVGACQGKPADRGLRVPLTTDVIKLDGHTDENAWKKVAVATGWFRDAGGSEIIPHTGAWFVRDDRRLYVLLYSSDMDVVRTDEAVVTVDGQTQRFHPGDAVVDIDGTLDKRGDDDEEWKVETAFDLKPGAKSAQVTLTRCDAALPTCSTWHGQLDLR
jgi:hypothetical protein